MKRRLNSVIIQKADCTAVNLGGTASNLVPMSGTGFFYFPCFLNHFSIYHYSFRRNKQWLTAK